MVQPLPVLVITGATASGKSEVALQLAKRLQGEILSADSAQVYRGLDIGTAKPTAAEQRSIPHHLIDLVAPTDLFSLADYLRQARTALVEVAARGRLPMLVGGTGLYVRALTEGYRLPQAGPDRQQRQRWQALLDRDGIEALYRELLQRSPARAGLVDPHNPRRIIRALEQVEADIQGGHMGDRKSETNEDLLPKLDPWKVFLDRERADLHERIEARFQQQLHQGLLAEVRALLGAGTPATAPGLHVLAYRQAIQHLAGELSHEQLIEEVVKRTRRFAKRQRTWFRREPGLEWLQVDADAQTIDVVEQVLQRLCLAKAGNGVWEPFLQRATNGSERI